MNLIYLHQNPTLCAQQYCDKDVSKGLLEIGQLLSTVIYKCSITRPGLYKPWVKMHHPLIIWCVKTYTNFLWTYDLFKALSDEFTFRTGKVHKSWIKLGENVKDLIDSAILKKTIDYGLGTISIYGQSYSLTVAPFFAPPQVVTRKYKVNRGTGIGLPRLEGLEYQSLATIMAYRRYYLYNTPESFTWTKRLIPLWFSEKNLWDIMDRLKEIERAHEFVPFERLGISPIGEPIYSSNTISFYRPTFNDEIDFGVLHRRNPAFTEIGRTIANTFGVHDATPLLTQGPYDF